MVSRSLVVLSLLLMTSSLVEAKAPVKKDENAKKPQAKIRISKETTFILEPVDEDGYINYLKALNQRFSKGVTPQNNAAVLICTVLGPHSRALAETDGYSEELFKRLGVEVPPDDGDYFVTLDTLIEEIVAKADPGDRGRLLDAFAEQQAKAMAGPWSKDDLPAMAKWVARNEKPLATLTKGLRRDRFYLPLVVEEEPPMLVNVALRVVSSHRELARLLKARAMLYLHEGKIEKAWQDLMSCHRLARHVSSASTLIEHLVGIAIESIALDGDLAVAASGKISKQQALKYRRQLEQLPPLPRIVEAIDGGERFMFLDAVAHLARGSSSLTEMFGDGDGTTAKLAKLASETLIDWNVPLVMANQAYDKLVAAGRLPSYRQRMRAAVKVIEEIESELKKGQDAKAFAVKVLFSGAPGKIVSKHLGRVLLGLLFPALGQAGNAEARADMRAELTQVALALAAYKSEHGSYPKSLEKLAPAYIQKLPADFYVEKPLTYNPSKNGYKLYAVGPNTKDDDGIEGDDVGIQVPIPRNEG